MLVKIFFMGIIELKKHPNESFSSFYIDSHEHVIHFYKFNFERIT